MMDMQCLLSVDVHLYHLITLLKCLLKSIKIHMVNTRISKVEYAEEIIYVPRVPK